PEGLEEQLAIAQFAVAHGTVVALLCGLGLALELLAPLMLLGRRWGLLLGSTFVVFHLSIASLMQLTDCSSSSISSVPFTGSAGRRELWGAYLAGEAKSRRLHPHDLIPAIDVKHLAGDRRRAVAREEESRLTKLGGIATALERSAFLIMLEH